MDRRPRPTILHVLLEVLSAVGSSLALTLILSSFEVAITALLTNKEVMVWGVLETTGFLIIAQVLIAPILFTGGAILLKWQKRIEGCALG